MKDKLTVEEMTELGVLAGKRLDEGTNVYKLMTTTVALLITLVNRGILSKEDVVTLLGGGS